jgi:O-antigen/teichoic acid export membrane protein
MTYSQLITAATNFLFTLLLARTLGVAQFGSAAILLTVLGFLIGLQRSLFGDPLLVVSRGRQELLGVTWAVLMMYAFLAAVPMFVLQRAGIAPVPFSLIAFVACAEDALRYVAFAKGRAVAAATADTFWFACMAVALVVMVARGLETPALLGIWAVGGGGAILFLCVVLRRVWSPQPQGLLRLWHELRGLGSWLAVQFLCVTGLSTFIAVAAGAVMGPAEYAPFRVAQVTLAPCLTLITAFSAPLLLFYAENRGENPWRRHTLIIGIVTAMAVAPIVIWADELLVGLFGEPYKGNAGLVLLLAAGVVAAAMSIPAGSMLRASKRGRAVMEAQLGGGALGMACAVPFAAWWGRTGLATGLLMEVVGVSVLTMLMVQRRRSWRTAASTL